MQKDQIFVFSLWVATVKYPLSNNCHNHTLYKSITEFDRALNTTIWRINNNGFSLWVKHVTCLTLTAPFIFWNNRRFCVFIQHDVPNNEIMIHHLSKGKRVLCLILRYIYTMDNVLLVVDNASTHCCVDSSIIRLDCVWRLHSCLHFKMESEKCLAKVFHCLSQFQLKLYK